MELQRYLKIVLRRWPIALSCLVVTAMLTAFFALQEESIYESKGTFVVRPRTADSDDVVRAMDTLVRGVEINSTYATIARSDRILERAEGRLADDTSTAGATVNAEVVTGSNVLEIAVTGPDPLAVHELAVAVGAETVAYVTELLDVYELAPLDPPGVPENPVGPNVPLRIGMGIVLGLGLGGLMALVSEVLLQSVLPGRSEQASRLERAGARVRPDDLPEHLARLFRSEDSGRSPGDEAPPAGPPDEEQPSTAFQQQLIGALHANRPFSVAVLWARPADARGREIPREAALERLEALVQEVMPPLDANDVPAYLGDGAFAVMLPDAGVEEAEERLRAWEAAIMMAAARGERSGGPPRISSRVLHYDGSEDRGDGASTVARMETR